MRLSATLEVLRDHALAELNAAHDYYADTRMAWAIVADTVAGGRTFSTQNVVTGTATTQTDLVGRAPGYVAEQLAEATFQQFLAIFEHFLHNLLRTWLLAFPHSLFSKKVDLKAVLDAPDKEALTLLVIDRELNELSYERPTAWFAYLEDRVKLGCPTPEEIDRIAEAKASRDVFVHNRGVVNAIYTAKAGRLARYPLGQRIDIPDPYHRDTWELLRKVVADLANAAIAKAP